VSSILLRSLLNRDGELIISPVFRVSEVQMMLMLM
jgi:hypothetical protein